jgi:hypothetical protein
MKFDGVNRETVKVYVLSWTKNPNRDQYWGSKEAEKL